MMSEALKTACIGLVPLFLSVLNGLMAIENKNTINVAATLICAFYAGYLFCLAFIFWLD